MIPSIIIKTSTENCYFASRPGTVITGANGISPDPSTTVAPSLFAGDLAAINVKRDDSCWQTSNGQDRSPA